MKGAKVTQKAKNLFKNEQKGEEEEIDFDIKKQNDDEFEIIGDFDAPEDVVSATSINEKDIDWYA